MNPRFRLVALAFQAGVTMVLLQVAEIWIGHKVDTSRRGSPPQAQMREVASD
jgi:hypothetical protein